ncbi:MAG: 30S ribosomal protein S20 [Trueperaceae bacterium]
MMARNPSAMKQHRQSVKARAANRAKKSTIRTFSKKTLEAAKAGNADEVKTMHKTAMSLIDKAAKGSTIHKRAAARKKSRLAKSLNRAMQAK